MSLRTVGACCKRLAIGFWIKGTAFPEEKKEQRVLGIDVGKVLDTVLKLSLWQWLLILIVLIILLGILYWAERRRLLKKKLRKLEKEKRLANENSTARPQDHKED